MPAALLPNARTCELVKDTKSAGCIELMANELSKATLVPKPCMSVLSKPAALVPSSCRAAVLIFEITFEPSPAIPAEDKFDICVPNATICALDKPTALVAKLDSAVAFKLPKYPI